MNEYKDKSKLESREEKKKRGAWKKLDEWTEKKHDEVRINGSGNHYEVQRNHFIAEDSSIICYYLCLLSI